MKNILKICMFLVVLIMFLGNSDVAYASESYTVKAGDTLSRIAKVQYNDISKWKEIYEANRDII